MGTIDVRGSGLGNSLEELLSAPDIVPGDQPSYELCKVLYLYHPLGAKMAESPIGMAQCQQREISVTNGPEDRIRDQFVSEWNALKADEIIFNAMALSRVYGITSLAMVSDALPPDQPIDFAKLADLSLSFSVFDPLNTAGSLILNQNPNAIDFMKVTTIAVSGKPYHRSRTVTMMNERPVYIAYTTSAFGFVGRSVYQRALFPMKSFVQSMVTDDLITKKAGVFIAKLGTAGAIIDNIMQSMAGMKRIFVKAATNGNVISIGKDENIETLNMQNIDGAYGMARKNVLENIAVAADMPAKLLNSETFAEGFGEGTEDAKHVARYIDRVRVQMGPLYEFFTRIVQHRAWNPDFYKIVQKEFPEYANVPYQQAFYDWTNGFATQWPSLLTEPESEKVKTDDVKLKAILTAIDTFGAILDPENKALLVSWAQDNINENKMMFQTPLDLDIEALRNYEPPVPVMGGGEGAEEDGEEKQGGRSDSAGRRRRRIRKLDAAEVHDLVDMMAQGADLTALDKHMHRIAA